MNVIETRSYKGQRCYENSKGKRKTGRVRKLDTTVKYK